MSSPIFPVAALRNAGPEREKILAIGPVMSCFPVTTVRSLQLAHYYGCVLLFVLRVAYQVMAARVAQRTDNGKLEMTIGNQWRRWTGRSIA